MSVVGALLAFVLVALLCWRRLHSDDDPGGTPSGAARRQKQVVVMASDGSETTAPLSLEGLESIDEVREALCELCAEVLDDDTLQAEDLLIEMRDVVGRTRPLTDSTQISAVLRAKSLRVRPRAASRGAADFA